MRLYELSQNYQAILQMIEEGNEDVLETLESLDEAIEDKAENIAKLIKTVEGQIATYQAEEKRLQANRKPLETTIKNLKGYIEQTMLDTGKRKIEGQLFKFAIQKNPPSVEVLDDSKIPKGYFTQPDPVLNKKEVLEALKIGHDVPGVQLKQGESLRIR